MPDSKSSYREQYLPMAIYAAKAYGIDPNFFISLLDRENSSWDPKQISSDGLSLGNGQVTYNTAQKYGVSKDQLADPATQIGLSAKIVSELMTKYNNDWWKVYAAYNAGEPAVDSAIKEAQDKSFGGVTPDWRSVLITKSDDYRNTINAANDVITKATNGQASQPDLSTFANSANKTYGPGASQTQNKWTDPSKPPNPQDFYTTDATGATSFDDVAFKNAMASYEQYWTAKKAQQEYEFGPYQAMMDDIIKEMSQGIAAGTLETTKASNILSNRANAYKIGLDALNSDAFKYGTNINAEYVPGREPGGFWEKHGLPPLKADHSNNVNPLQWAVGQAQAGDQMFGNINVPKLGDYPGIPGVNNGSSIPAAAQVYGAGIDNNPPPPVSLDAAVAASRASQGLPPVTSMGSTSPMTTINGQAVPNTTPESIDPNFIQQLLQRG